eukprot:gnl/TRDRNA2_/TRDRNA2_169890_c0_seq9.p1 gnl/TRDRNA2_/TRDRNA2_169890_c0~~gnl/TRDRNA2_/TRDRNA2_169890_c0_seq9.p1  ORF type:complete len:251 (-),score=32.29 gnl/TRDRNA2_/TRDRNA2_169890_c0_seq9:37-789(-)
MPEKGIISLALLVCSASGLVTYGRNSLVHSSSLLQNNSAGTDIVDKDVALHRCGIPNCQYINLAKRNDRRQQVEHELGQAGMTCDRVEAVDAHLANVTGREACRRSHLSALDRIEASGLPYGLILEDDMMWEQGNQTLQKMFCDIEKHINDYPVILLACNGGRIFPGRRQLDPEFQFVEACQTTSAYVIRRDYIKTLRYRWEEESHLAIDQTWKRLQPAHGWAMTSPLLVKQRPSWSDIEGRYVDYKASL